MAITINGDGTLTGISVGGLPDGIVDTDMLATNAVSSAKIQDGAGGKVLQVVYGSTASTFSTSSVIATDDTIPQNTEGTEFLTQAITPVSASSDLIIQVNCPFVSMDGIGNNIVSLFVDSTADALATASTVTATSDYEEVLTLVYKVASSSTTERTYKARFGTNTAGRISYLNRSTSGRRHGGTLITSICIYEVL